MFKHQAPSTLPRRQAGKTQINNNFQSDKSRNPYYDLEERCFRFAKNVALYCRKLPFTATNQEYKKQVIRSSGSVGANYIEANESLSRKDFLLRIKICRKEAKESAYWLRLLLEINREEASREGKSLEAEAIELKKIFCAIVEKSK